MSGVPFTLAITEPIRADNAGLAVKSISPCIRRLEMARKAEILRLQQAAVESGGYVARLCPKCNWWQCVGGSKERFEQDYCPDIRCKCEEARDGKDSSRG